MAGATPTNAPLTVGDVIHQLPPEVVRMGALPAEQPLSLPPALLENALRSGQAALPVFELYRVCPALFQVPISPQDPRLVALPATKLPGLIAQAREGNAAAPPAAAQVPSPFQMGAPAAETKLPSPQASSFSPFATAEPSQASPFSAAQPAPLQAPASPFSLGGGSPAGSPFGMPQSQAPQQTPAAASASPFSLGSGSPAGSPFGIPQSQTPQQSPAAASASPFSLGGGSPGGSPFSMPQASAPQQAPAAGSASPFSLGGSSPAGSPFSMPQSQAPQPSIGSPAGSPFSFGSTRPAGSPFGAQQPPAAAAPSPLFAPAPVETQNTEAVPPQASISNLFTPKAQQRASTPSDMVNSPATPFGSPFMSAMKEAAPQPEAPAMSAFATMPQTPPPAPAQPQQQPGGAPAAQGVAKLGFAAVLSGYSMEELGFNPITLPAWITTNIPASTLNEQISSGSITLELGALIDGLSDLGFRNTLSGAKRDCRIKLPQNEVFHALTHMSAAPAPAAAATAFSSPAQQTRMVVQTAAPQQAAPVQAPAPIFAAAAPAQTSMFATPAPAPTPMFAAAAPQAKSPASTPLEPVFGATLNPFAQSQPAASAPSPSPLSAFAAVQPAANPAPAPAFGSAPASAFSAFATPQPTAATPLISAFGSAPSTPAPVAPAQAPFAFSATPPAAETPQSQPAFTAPSLFSTPAQPAPAPSVVPSLFVTNAQPQQAPAAAPSLFSAPAQPAPAAGPSFFASGSQPPSAAAPASSPSLFSTSVQPANAPASAPLHAQSAGFQPLGAPQMPALGQVPGPLTSPLSGAAKPFDPFASSASGPLPAKAPLDTGFSSAELLGQVPTPQQQPDAPFAPAPEIRPASGLFASSATSPSGYSFAPGLEEMPSFSAPAPTAHEASPTRGLFSPPPAASAPLLGGLAAAAAKLNPKPATASETSSAPAPAASKLAAVKHSFLGLAPLDTQTDQLLLRALLGTEENLSAARVVELMALQHGLSACVCLHGAKVLSHADPSKPDATEFQRQAPDIARQLRGLAPLIGIEGAETFTLNAGGRLLTFCFPGETIIGVLHDDEPSNGMRDKITLLARELSRMLG